MTLNTSISRATSDPPFLIIFGRLYPSPFTLLLPFSPDPTHLCSYAATSDHHLSLIHSTVCSTSLCYSASAISSSSPPPSPLCIEFLVIIYRPCLKKIHLYSSSPYLLLYIAASPLCMLICPPAHNFPSICLVSANSPFPISSPHPDLYIFCCSTPCFLLFQCCTYRFLVHSCIFLPVALPLSRVFPTFGACILFDMLHYVLVYFW